MARPPSFNRALAVDDALKLFWRRGYVATSLPELLDAMGVARSSFYATFSSKRELFSECLELFGSRTLTILDKPGGSCENLSVIRTFFNETISEVPEHRISRGCMMVNTVLELADVDLELQILAQTKLDKIQERFQCLILDAQLAGEITGAHCPAELADALMTLNLGIRVQCRKQVERTQLVKSVDTSLRLLGIAA
ncbi:MAG: TetR/AcrR family transcriptional regulator [Halioglobus sp.]